MALRSLKASLVSHKLSAVLLTVLGTILFAVAPALAHHPFGGGTPDNVVEAFLSGMGHPVIGIDHLTFVIAAGLLAAAIGGGLGIPISFVVASIGGTGIHLLSIDLPLPELVISASVLLFGVLLAMKTQPANSIVMGLAAIAGIFHGFAYGEAIFGAEMGPLVAYLLGFAAIQLGIATGTYWAAKTILVNRVEPSGLALRFAGFVICGVGTTFLTTMIVDSIFPA
ncbi:MAG: HupE/UreJ family protein [Cyanobacteria bacterium J06659_2]